MTSRLGATLAEDGRCIFVVWAPLPDRVELRLGDSAIQMKRLEHGYRVAEVERVRPGDRYAYSLDGGPERSDPASRWQPEGVHGRSAVVDPAAFRWTDGAFAAPALRDLVIYELHVGTFTAEGTFDAAIRHFRELRELGITAIEPMPIAQFPGTRNWGYDGVLPWAAQNSYGGPEGFRRFVDAAHAAGLAVLLDVVYNHFGPEGSYLREFGPYTTDRYKTPWGEAMNFDGPDSDDVRRFFIESALMWLRECHVDGFRVDAQDAIVDTSAYPFLAELTDTVLADTISRGRRAVVIAESDENDVRVLAPTSERGLGFDAAWSDDFHHALHVAMTGEQNGYYGDFDLTQLAETYRRGWAYAGQYSRYRRRRHGNDPSGHRAERFVFATQNHDQVGNRARGERLIELAGAAKARLAAAALLLTPFTPHLFMGEEYGERSPFLYFTDHGDPELARAVRDGRRAEFKRFGWPGEVPDPQGEETFRASILDRASADAGLAALYRDLLRARRTVPGLLDSDLARREVRLEGGLLTVRSGPTVALLNFSDGPIALNEPHARCVLDTADTRYGGTGSEPDRVAPTSAVLLSA